MVPAFDGYVETVVSVSSTSLISVERNKYSVPCAYAGRKLSVRLYPEHIEARDEETVVAVHTRSFERGEVCYDWQHYIALIEKKPGALRNGAPFEGLPAPLQRLRGALMRLGRVVTVLSPRCSPACRAMGWRRYWWPRS
jgi:hypothetical protein